MSFQMVSSSTLFPKKYDVFISFRGEDTRKNFTDHLYTALIQKGIDVFKDDKQLESGKPISPELLQAIEESRFSIVVLSTNYAASTWCLKELAKIVECMKKRRQIVIPIFYHVDPSMVRKQTGDFQKAFVKHEEIFRENTKMVQTWRNALTDVANISGYDAKDRYESELIQEIVKGISSKLSHSSMCLEDLVGINSHLEKLMKHISDGSNDVRMIGLWGMGGIGKTTIARVVYESIAYEFDGCSFLANVGEISDEKDGLISLQRKLLSQILHVEKDINIHSWYDGVGIIRRVLKQKKILVIIDDVVHIRQLNALAEKREWFGSGSRIIITTRDKRLLETHGVDQVYEVEKLNDVDSIKLFSLNAFKRNQPPKNFAELSNRFISYAGGLPLALKVLGSFLFGRGIKQWKSELERLDREPKKEILDILQMSFDGLEEAQKKIFLYIACFFNGNDRDYITKILEDRDCYPIIGIDVLIEKSLITISKENKLWMHDLLQQMGQQIVKRKSLEEPGKCCIFWVEANFHDDPTRNMGAEAVEGIIFENKLHLSVSAKASSKMINIRFLKVHKRHLKVLEYISNKLQFLESRGNLSNSLQSNLQPDEIFELQMPFSRMKQLWKQIIHPLNTLKSISLQHCQDLDEIPDLKWPPNLESLLLQACPKLRRINSPFLVHKKLTFLEVSDCTSLKTLPSKIHMESLEKLKIFGCPKLKKFPEIVGSMERLNYFCVNRTATKDMPLPVEPPAGFDELILANGTNHTTLPSGINCPLYLELLNPSGCSNHGSLPFMINGLKLRRTLDLCDCFNLVSLPPVISGLTSVEYLDPCECTSFTIVPSVINGLISLENLKVPSCSSLAILDPSTVNDLKRLRTLNLSCRSKTENMPVTLGQVKPLEELDLCGIAIAEPISFIILRNNLKVLTFRGCRESSSKSWCFQFVASLIPRIQVMILRSSSISCSLTCMYLSYCNLGGGAISYEPLVGLWFLVEQGLSGNDFLSLPAIIIHLPNLEILNLKHCKILQSLLKLPSHVDDLICASLERLSNRRLRFSSSSCSLKHLDLSYCNLGEGAISYELFVGLCFLEYLDLSGNDFLSLPASIILLSNLKFLYLEDCKRLQSLPKLPSHVDCLLLNGCVSLERFSNALNQTIHMI